MGPAFSSRSESGIRGNDRIFDVEGKNYRSGLGLVHTVPRNRELRLAYRHHGTDSIGHGPTFRRANGQHPLGRADGTLFCCVLDGLLVWAIQTGRGWASCVS